MKKNIFLILGIMTSTSLFAHESCNEFELAELDEAQECHQKYEQSYETLRSCEESDEFEDFFGGEDEESSAQPRQQKQKPSRIQLAMIRLGIAAALHLESCYNYMRSFYAYLTSWVVRENRKA